MADESKYKPYDPVAAGAPNADGGTRFITNGEVDDIARARYSDSFFEEKRLQEALRDAKPLFTTDGNGIQGPPAAARRTEDEMRRTDFGNGQVIRQPSQPPFPSDRAPEGGTINGDSVDLYGAFNGAPATFHLLQTAAPTPTPP